MTNSHNKILGRYFRILSTLLALRPFLGRHDHDATRRGSALASRSYSPKCVERLSGNSEGAPFRGPAGLRNGVQGTLFRRFALPTNAPSDPSSYFPDSLSTTFGEYPRRVDAETLLLYNLTSIQDVQDAQPARSRARTGDWPASSAPPRLGADRASTLRAGARPGSRGRPPVPRGAVLRSAGPVPSPASREPPQPSRSRFVLL